MHVVVVGAGIAGLTAARDLAAAGHRVSVLEGAAELGGKLRRHEVAGVGVDVGAEAMLSRRPEGVELARTLGLNVVHPTAATSRVWTRGALRRLPRTLLGAPLDRADLESSGVLSEAGLRRAVEEQVTDFDADVSVGHLVAARFGDEVTDRLVEPMLGGVYAGRAREISALAAAPQLVAIARQGPILGAQLPDSQEPVFAGIGGGMSQLTDALAAGLDVRTETTVRGVHRVGPGFELVTGSAARPDLITADSVVLATPAAPTARLLSGLVPAAASELEQIEAASVVVVTLALRADQAVAVVDLGASGFLVPPGEVRSIKASTFSFAKWEWVAEAGAEHDLLIVRTSIGRHRDTAAMQASDDELVAWSLRDLTEITGLRTVPVDAHVQRWGGGLPQYAVGHLDRVARIRAAVAAVPGLALCGATYDGVGVAACIASAHRAATQLTTPGTMGA